MAAVPPSNDVPTGILAFRNGSIGNTLVALPALRALRRAHPKARLSVVVDPPGAELLARVDWIDDLITYDKRGRDSGPVGTVRFAGRLRSLRPSHAILFKRFFRNGLLARLSGARVRVGFSTNGKAPFLNRTIPYREGVRVAELNLELAARLGAGPASPLPELPLAPSDRDAAAARLAADGLTKGRYVTAHYGGHSTDPGFLPVERFADLVARVVRPGDAVLLVGRGAREAEAARWLLERLPAARLAVNEPVLVTAALIEAARLHVGMNSGPAHLAAAVGTPALVVFRPGPGRDAEIAKWLPPTERARALKPPDPRLSGDWHHFLDEADGLARTLVT